LPVQEYIDNNRKRWDGVVPLHVASQFYDVASFKAGRSSLMRVELEEVGPVAGKTLLHLQCHFGMDTLSWARLSADVTGVDFSGPAIAHARQLSTELDIPSRFIETDVYRLPEVLRGDFDIVFASYGVICWLPDFSRWAEVAASYVKPGGFLYLLDGHPFGSTLDDESAERPMRLRYPYRSGGVPMVFEDDGTYADRTAVLPHKRSYQFNHGLGEIVTALADAGLRVDFLREFPFAAWQKFSDMTKGADGFYYPSDETDVPLMFSVKASRPA
jgi:SAM-dependent methyltransferase